MVPLLSLPAPGAFGRPMFLIVIALGGCGFRPLPRTSEQKAMLSKLYRSRSTELKRRCDRDELVACAAYGHRAVGFESDTSDTEARAALEKACTGGVPYGCLGLSYVLRDSKTPGDVGRGESLRLQACAQGLEVCRRSMSNAEDQAVYLRYLKARCDADDPTGCFQRGSYLLQWHYAGRRKEPQDLPAARLDLGRACALGFASGCLYQAYLEEEGLGGPVDGGRAAMLYGEACKLRDGVACNILRQRGSDGAVLHDHPPSGKPTNGVPGTSSPTGQPKPPASAGPPVASGSAGPLPVGP